jgi:hypothetical protein
MKNKLRKINPIVAAQSGDAFNATGHMIAHILAEQFEHSFLAHFMLFHFQVGDQLFDGATLDEN